MPTHGEATVAKIIKRHSTTIDNNTVGEINSAYDDLLAIWDAHEDTLDDSSSPQWAALGLEWIPVLARFASWHWPRSC